MDYSFLKSSIDVNDIVLPESDAINPFLRENNRAEIIKALDFLASDDIFLHVHGFLGTGKRQFINYITEFSDSEVIKLEYYCKVSTVCDDILLSFIDMIDKNAISKAVNLNTKITTLSVKFQHYISSIKKPFLIILHSYDDVLEENKTYIADFLSLTAKNTNVKFIISTRGMLQNTPAGIKADRKIFLKAFTKEIFKKFLDANQISCTNTTMDDFYKCTRGYYYYTALSVKIIQGMKISLNEFLGKYTSSGMNFEDFLGLTYINLIPVTIRNFFWFLRTMRHGLTLNALAVFELYDEFSVEYLKLNLMIFQSNETIYVQDYFLQNIDISIPQKTEIKLHKYIINIYEKQLKEQLAKREIMISRQALRAEIEYHGKCIEDIENGVKKPAELPKTDPPAEQKKKNEPQETVNTDTRFARAQKLVEEKKITEAIEEYNKILSAPNLDIITEEKTRLILARLYKEIEDYGKSRRYYELAEVYYKKNNEVINLNYLYYELTDLYFLMYKTELAIETIKKVIYSVDTPQSLMVASCTLLGNIYSAAGNPEAADSYYEKALASLDENTKDDVLAELYFKYALANDDKNDSNTAFEYYTKCTLIQGGNPYKALAYSNMASCYYENGNDSDALDCFLKAYNIEKSHNNYEGIYYNASGIAKIYSKERNNKALKYLLEAKQSAEFVNEDYCIMEASVALGDYYYNDNSKNKNALAEYCAARKIANNISDTNISKIESRINDMKLRMTDSEFEEIEKKYV